MADLATVLRENTYKQQGVEVEQRIYYTLTDNKAMTQHRTAKLLSLLIAEMMKDGKLRPKDLDDMLLELLG